MSEKKIPQTRPSTSASQHVLIPKRAWAFPPGSGRQSDGGESPETTEGRPRRPNGFGGSLNDGYGHLHYASSPPHACVAMMRQRHAPPHQPFPLPLFDAWCRREVLAAGRSTPEDVLARAATHEALALAAWWDGESVTAIRGHLDAAVQIMAAESYLVAA